jgi:hypothetical protein
LRARASRSRSFLAAERRATSEASRESIGRDDTPSGGAARTPGAQRGLPPDLGAHDGAPLSRELEQPFEVGFESVVRERLQRVFEDGVADLIVSAAKFGFQPARAGTGLVAERGIGALEHGVEKEAAQLGHLHGP